MRIQQGGPTTPTAFDPTRVPDHVTNTLTELLETDDSRAFVTWCEGLASRDHYPRGANELQSIVTGIKSRYYRDEAETVTKSKSKKEITHEGSLIGTIWTAGNFKIYKIGVSLGVIKSSNHTEIFLVEDLIALVDGPKGANARCALACLGHVERKPWTPDDPLPNDRRERAALALHLLVNAMADR